MKKKTLLSWSSGKDSAWTLHVLQQQQDIEVVRLFLLLKEGRVVKTGDPKIVLNKSLLEESYGCRMMIDENPLGRVVRVTPVPDKYLEYPD